MQHTHIASIDCKITWRERGGVYGHRPFSRERSQQRQTYILMLGKHTRLTVDLFTKPFPFVFFKSNPNISWDLSELILLEVFNKVK